MRRQWRLGEVVVAVDDMTGLGSFAEFEYAGDAGAVDEAVAALHKTISALEVELGKRDHRGYPYLLLNRDR